MSGTSKATLIVCPDAILPQWTSEIQRHSAPGALKVMEYGGQRNSLMTSLGGALTKVGAVTEPVTSRPPLARARLRSPSHHQAVRLLLRCK